MGKDSSDQRVRNHIEQLVKEEHELYEQATLSHAERERLESVQLELDQYWDLLRQRRALREFGRVPDRAQIRARDVVEQYEQ
jgi:hypothetical protein